MKCVACGSDALIDGKIVVNQGIKFHPSDDAWLRRMFDIGGRELRAYGCIHCGHLQIAVNFTDKDRERYQQFRGEQPDLLNRLNSESEDTDDKP